MPDRPVPIVDPHTGEVHQAQIFIGVLGASNYTYAEAQGSQELSNWIGAHVRMFAFVGGVPDIVVPDNLKAGVKHPVATSRSEPHLPRPGSALRHGGHSGSRS